MAKAKVECLIFFRKKYESGFTRGEMGNRITGASLVLPHPDTSVWSLISAKGMHRLLLGREVKIGHTCRADNSDSEDLGWTRKSGGYRRAAEEAAISCDEPTDNRPATVATHAQPRSQQLRVNHPLRC